MAKKAAVAKTAKSTKVSKAQLKNGVKKSKAQKPSAKKVVKTKQVKKTPVKVSKRLAEKKQTKSTVKKTIKPKKVVKIAKPAKPSKPTRPTKKTSQTSGPKGYTPAQYAKFKYEKENLEEKTNQELKDELRKNMQSMSGNKDELIYKVADGIVLGRIPRCPKCFGGRPKFDFKKGTYHCSGYRDDEDFKNCHTTFQLNEIKRQPWQ